MDMSSSGSTTTMSGSMDMSSNMTTINTTSMNGSTMPDMGVMHSYFFASVVNSTM